MIYLCDSMSGAHPLCGKESLLSVMMGSLACVAASRSMRICLLYVSLVDYQPWFFFVVFLFFLKRMVVQPQWCVCVCKGCDVEVMVRREECKTTR